MAATEPEPDRDLQAMEQRMSGDLAAIEKMRMPFGKYGPKDYPPAGVPIYDLPAEYLGFFASKGWPKGRLGDLLRMVYQMKVDGADLAFDPLRQRAGGRTILRPDGRVTTRKFVQSKLHDQRQPHS